MYIHTKRNYTKILKVVVCRGVDLKGFFFFHLLIYMF
jgi:hypothetical protein